MSKSGQFMKRALDLLVSSLGLVILSPVVALTALAVYMDSGWPVFYLQERLGKSGCIFRIMKFRTMKQGASVLLNESGDVVNESGDVRHTRIGRLLRRFSIDELPQLINVWRGEMSLIGPRPDVPGVLGMYTSEERRKLNVKPGMSGLAQIKGRNAISAREKWAYDAEYAQTATFAGDLGILLRTAGAVFRRSGIYRQRDVR